MQEYFKIGEISKLYHIGVDSLRYYEKIGILHPDRAESGYRHYSIHDIWKLNIIRDLRSLGFSMEQIRKYLENHNAASTLDLLEEEEKTIEKKIENLQNLRCNVQKRLRTIRAAQQRQTHTFSLEKYPPRHCCSIQEGYSDAQEMDVLIKRLMNMDQEHLYVIGNNQIGTVISMDEIRKSGRIRYQSVFVIDDFGSTILPGGIYLSVSYRGAYEQSAEWIRKIREYAAENQIRLKGDIFEMLWIDIHTSSKVEEYMTELQILTDKT